MKLDVKSILILILLSLTLLFGFKWFWGGNKESKQRVKELEKEYKELEAQKKLVDLEIISWREKSDSLMQLDIKLQSEISKQESIIKRAEMEAQKSKANLDKIRQELLDTQKKIAEIKNHPPNRTGEDLLESLKNKTKN